MRYIAPARDAVDPRVFGQMPLAAWREHAGLFESHAWPCIEALNACRPAGMRERFAAQTRELLADGLHYEQRIAERGEIATRENNWHDLFNALIWLRHPVLKRALNARQMAEIAHMGIKQRSRAQYALTHFDEAGVVVALRDTALLALWDAHDWHGLFWRERAAWLDGRIRVDVFGHALLEHALTPGQLLVGKAMVVADLGASPSAINDVCAQAILGAEVLRDPLELRPLPLCGLPGWDEASEREAFHLGNPSYCPLREGRRYPAPLLLAR
jgi:hypothetical protein